MDIAKVGLDKKSGLGLRAAIDILISEGVMQKDVINKARVLTSPACDARMSGINMPVISNDGSRNHGSSRYWSLSISYIGSRWN